MDVLFFYCYHEALRRLVHDDAMRTSLALAATTAEAEVDKLVSLIRQQPPPSREQVERELVHMSISMPTHMSLHMPMVLSTQADTRHAWSTHGHTCARAFRRWCLRWKSLSRLSSSSWHAPCSGRPCRLLTRCTGTIPCTRVRARTHVRTCAARARTRTHARTL